MKLKMLFENGRTCIADADTGEIMFEANENWADATAEIDDMDALYGQFNTYEIDFHFDGVSAYCPDCQCEFSEFDEDGWGSTDYASIQDRGRCQSCHHKWQLGENYE